MTDEEKEAFAAKAPALWIGPCTSEKAVTEFFGLYHKRVTHAVIGC